MTKLMPTEGQALLERLTAAARPDGECLVWTKYVNDCGYGRVSIAGRQQSVHRVAWVARHGDIPPETPLVLHRCDNPPCFRDEHLFLGTTQDNVDDKVRKGRHRHGGEGRTHCKRGHSLENAYVYYSATGQRRRQCRACALAAAVRQRRAATKRGL